MDNFEYFSNKRDVADEYVLLYFTLYVNIYLMYTYSP